ncbi:MAG: hypothetical protein AB8F78_15515, partial [Saprospiraceae bacterium]
LAPWTAGSYLHAFNRACHNNDLFHTDRHRERFLHTMGEKLAPFVDILSFNLLENHFHSNLELKSENELKSILEVRSSNSSIAKLYLKGEATYEQVIAQVFRSFGVSYSRYFNLSTQRKGRLYGQEIRRVQNDGNMFHRAPVAYVLLNHEKHNIPRKGATYPWTSLNPETRPSWVKHDLLVERFGGAEAFREYLVSYMKLRGKAFHTFDEELFFGIEPLPKMYWAGDGPDVPGVPRR